jgi:hypothetical protein
MCWSAGADAADGADDTLEPCIHLDDPVSGVALTTKGNLDTHGPQKRLRAPQSAGQGARIFGPVAPTSDSIVTAAVSAKPQQVAGATGPRAVFGYQLAHAGGHRVGIDGVCDRSLAIGP